LIVHATTRPRPREAAAMPMGERVTEMRLGSTGNAT
jgi:hypothetical protein